MRRSAWLLLALALAAAACRANLQTPDNSDSAVKARVEAALRGRSDLDIRYVSVDVTDKTATISGMAPTREQIREISRLVKRIKGVESALINLVVNE